MDLPSGTLTFLLTDIEGSTRLWEQHPETMGAVVARHEELLTAAITASGGVVVRERGEGDSLFAVFPRATGAVAAACALQKALLAEPWPLPEPLRVRAGLHTGEAELRDRDYYGTAVNRAARLRGLAHGGQSLLSQSTRQLVHEDLPPDVSLRDLGLHRLKGLQRAERIYQIVHPDLPADFPPLASDDALPNNLPLPATSFVGRERELAALREQLAGARLLTLTGIGGCGKTRLALQVAAELLPEYPDGVWLVELAALTDPALVPQAVAAVLGVREGVGSPATGPRAAPHGRPLVDTLIDALQTRRLLLVLDNCEHLVGACADLARALLRAAPGVRILATSRELLGVSGEAVWPVPPLSLPDGTGESEAVTLFVERARLCRPGFALGDTNRAAVAAICRRLDGIPLAIELAAARVKVLSPEQIAARLDDCFRLLTGGGRDLLPRQQTLRAAIDWSYDLLSEEERRLLACLSIFAGGFTLEAAEEVCCEAEVLDLLGQLVDKSLVVVEDRGIDLRYRLLETIRQYGREKLRADPAGESALCRRHRDRFLRLAETAAEGLTGPEQAEWLDRLAEEHDNLRAALAGALADAAGDPEARAAGLRLAAALWRFWAARGYLSEGRERLQALLDLARRQGAPADATLAAVLNGAGALAYYQADYDAAYDLWEESLALRRALEDEPGVAATLGNMGLVAQARGDRPAARALHEESLAIRRRLGDRHGMAASLNNLGLVTAALGDLAAARTLHEESLAIRRRLGDQAGIASSLQNLGQIADAQGDRDAARACHEESLAIRRELEDRAGVAASLNSLGNLALDHGEHEQARSLYEECLETLRELGDRQGIATALGNLGHIAHALGDLARARALHEESLAIMRELEDLAGIATGLGNLGPIARALGDPETARRLSRESLALWQRLKDQAGIAEALEALALAGPDDDRAVRLLAAAGALRERLGLPLAPSERAEQEERTARLRAALGDAAFAAAWEAGCVLPVEQAIADALEG